MTAFGARNGRLSTRNFGQRAAAWPPAALYRPLFCTQPALLVIHLSSCCWRSTSKIVPPVSTGDQNDAENGSPLRPNPGPPAWSSGYKMLRLPSPSGVFQQPSPHPTSAASIGLDTLDSQVFYHRIQTLAFVSEFSSWRLCPYAQLKSMTTNTGPTQSFVRKLEPD